ncbi:flagellar basal-body MS-ring/collar protein FliF [Treponema phagedenis]|uniref:flagellar basal-body MS-ring/collar protein FliF n=1 Tax=Treponema phagedenis TaxID=162 RepID=UPI0002E72B04|nr:flagellar basal-body MS-ring/collar protein FliF [Treponema phagedenis]
MNEWIKKTGTKLKELWGKWSVVQKLVLAGVILAAIIGMAVLFTWSSAPTTVPLIDVPISDEAAREKIILRLNEENISASVSATGLISVPDEKTARRMRSILIREDLIPKNVDPWAIFDVERWTRTDFERKVDVRRAINKMVTDHIKALDDVDDANVIINVPEDTLFKADQKPITASVVLFTKPGSDIETDRKKIQGIQKLLKLAVPGLLDENITIADSNAKILNDFEGMKDMDRLTLIEKQQKMIAKLETQYEIKILTLLQKTYGKDRVRDLNIKIDMDMSEKTAQTTKYLPTEIRPDNPETPWDDSEIVPSITAISETATTTWQGTGLTPEGPAGVEGQTPPAYKDMTNQLGMSNQSIVKRQEAISKSEISEVISPVLGRRTVSVNIDGEWRKKRDDKGNLVISEGRIEREYIPISPEELQEATRAVQNAIGYDANRKDSISVLNIRFDRVAEFEAEDAAYFRAQQRNMIILISLGGFAILLLIFILYRIISRELERLRRLREEDELRKAQMAREAALRAAEMNNIDVAMSVEERKRLELQENVINMAREHPEDVALLIRTWLMEE